jgi:hypothetical protein
VPRHAELKNFTHTNERKVKMHKTKHIALVSSLLVLVDRIN